MKCGEKERRRQPYPHIASLHGCLTFPDTGGPFPMGAIKWDRTKYNIDNYG